MTCAVMYRAARARLSDLFGTLNADQLRLSVPATPRWTV
jgi:hypothetical protein